MTTPTTGRTLMLLRHAEAEQVEGKVDKDRELTSRGRSDARAVGQFLGHPSQPALDLVLCSASQRTRQTLDGLAAGGASLKKTFFDERIYSAGAASLLDVLREVPDSVNTVLMIGHAPGIPVLATALVADGVEVTPAIDLLSKGFPTCALAILGFEDGWAALASEAADLRDFVVRPG